MNVGGASQQRPRLTFPAHLRVRRKSDFVAIYKRGKRLSDSIFTLTFTMNTTGVPRLGLAIAARTVGNAVARNRVRRVIRESFRLAQHALPHADIVVGARNAARTATNDALRNSLAALWVKLAKSCA